MQEASDLSKGICVCERESVLERVCEETLSLGVVRGESYLLVQAAHDAKVERRHLGDALA